MGETPHREEAFPNGAAAVGHDRRQGKCRDHGSAAGRARGLLLTIHVARVAGAQSTTMIAAASITAATEAIPTASTVVAVVVAVEGTTGMSPVTVVTIITAATTTKTSAAVAKIATIAMEIVTALIDVRLTRTDTGA